MPAFSRSARGSGRKTIRVWLEAPGGESFEAQVFTDETIGELTQEFYEFLNAGWNAAQARVYWVDPVTARATPLDGESTLKSAGIPDGARLRFAPEEAVFDAGLTPEQSLKVSLPFPPKLTASHFAWYAHDFLSASDLMYSLFSVLLSGDVRALGALERLLNEDPVRMSEMAVIHQQLKISGGHPLELQKVQYGSPMTFIFEGSLKALELLKGFVSEVKRAPHNRKMDEHEEHMARFEEQQARIALVQSYLNLADSGDVKLPKEVKAKLIMAVLPQVEALDMVLQASARGSRK
jgi:hypothetical protein